MNVRDTAFWTEVALYAVCVIFNVRAQTFIVCRHPCKNTEELLYVNSSKTITLIYSKPHVYTAEIFRDKYIDTEVSLFFPIISGMYQAKCSFM